MYIHGTYCIKIINIFHVTNGNKYKVKIRLFTLWRFKRHCRAERSVSLRVASLDLEVVHRVRMQTLYDGLYLVADNTLDQPITIPLCVVSGVNDEIS